MDEATFLRRQQDREEQQRARRLQQQQQGDWAEGEGVASVAITEQREAFAREVERLHVELTELLDPPTVEGEKPTKPNLDSCLTLWRAMQKYVQEHANVLQLPPRDLRNTNLRLSSDLAAINARRESHNPRKKFRFTRRPIPSADVLRHHEAKQAKEAAAADASAAGSSSLLAGAIANSDGRTIVVADARGVVVADKTNQRIAVGSHPAVFLQRLTGCTVFVQPVSGSVFLSDCTDCTVYVACQQLRIKTTNGTTLYAQCGSTPVIEASTKMRFASYRAWQYPNRRDAIAAAGLKPVEGDADDVSYKTVHDFHWLKHGQQSPHWSVVECPTEWATVDGAITDADCVF